MKTVSKVVLDVILIVIYFFFFVPLAMALRLLGRDKLVLTHKKNKVSWEASTSEIFSRDFFRSRK